jgi:NAD(P)-dependent dehydrogenase (short-subunit alcohol dehydrogenase family)
MSVSSQAGVGDRQSREAALGAKERAMDMAGKAAVVTGGASGLGAATAEALARAGAKVAVADRNAALAQATAARIGGMAIGCDVTDPASAEAAFARARAANGPVRVLVNCAGIGDAGRIVGRDGPLPLAAFAKVINVNLIGTFNMLRLAAAEMAALEPGEDGERGVVINTASVAAYEGQIGQAAYAASKAGVVGLTIQAARELARSGIRVVTIAPGLIDTPMFDGLKDEFRESLAASVPFPARLGRPQEYASLAMFIVGNRYVNGETIRLDGALRMAPR